MMKRIVISFGRTAFRSRNFKALRMAARDEPAGYGANTGLNTHGPRQGTQKSWTADAKDQIHDFKKDKKLEQKGQAKAYEAETQKAANEGMTANKQETLKTTNNTTDMNTAQKNTAGNSPHDTFRPWEAKSQGASQTENKLSGDNSQKSADQGGQGAFMYGSQMKNKMSAADPNNAWEANHVHNSQCGHRTSDSAYNKTAKTCANDSAACRMDSGKCSTHKSQQTSQTGSNYGATTQNTNQGMMDKAMSWVKEKFGGGNTEATSNQDIKQKNRATADSDKAFKDKKEFKQDQH